MSSTDNGLESVGRAREVLDIEADAAQWCLVVQCIQSLRCEGSVAVFCGDGAGISMALSMALFRSDEAILIVQLQRTRATSGIEAAHLKPTGSRMQR